MLALPALAHNPACNLRAPGKQLNLHRRCLGRPGGPAWIALWAADLGTPQLRVPDALCGAEIRPRRPVES